MLDKTLFPVESKKYNELYPNSLTQSQVTVQNTTSHKSVLSCFFSAVTYKSIYATKIILFHRLRPLYYPSS